MAPEQERIEVRATVNMARLGAGQHAWVDPKDPQIKAMLSSGLLYPIRAADRNPDWAPDRKVDPYHDDDQDQTDEAAPPPEDEAEAEADAEGE